MWLRTRRRDPEPVGPKPDDRCPARGPNGELCAFMAVHVESEYERNREHEWHTAEEITVRRSAWQINEASYALNSLVASYARRGMPIGDLALWSGLPPDRIRELVHLMPRRDDEAADAGA